MLLPRTVSWAASKAAWPARQGSDPAPLLSTDETSPGVLHPGVESSVQGGQGRAGVHPAEGQKNDPRDGTCSQLEYTFIQSSGVLLIATLNLTTKINIDAEINLLEI